MKIMIDLFQNPLRERKDSMIQKIGQVMLYVENIDEVTKFWTEDLGFALINKSDEEIRWREIAPSQDSETSFVLYEREVIAKMEPELNLGTPSIMFFTEDLAALYAHMKSREINVGALVEIPGGKVFNFSDREGNYFAVMEPQK